MINWWFGILRVPSSNSPIHFRGSNRNPNHRAPNHHPWKPFVETNKPTNLPILPRNWAKTSSCCCRAKMAKATFFKRCSAPQWPADPELGAFHGGPTPWFLGFVCWMGWVKTFPETNSKRDLKLGLPKRKRKSIPVPSHFRGLNSLASFHGGHPMDVDKIWGSFHPKILKKFKK